MPIPTNNSRPAIPYNPEQVLPNHNRYQALGKFPPTAQQLDGDFNGMIDLLNTLAGAINDTAAGIFPGAGNPLNADKLPTTDGQGNVSWTHITPFNITDNAVQTRHIQDAAIISSKIQAQAVGTNQLADGNVTTAKMPDNAVTTAKIADNAVTAAKVIDGCLTESKLADGAVTIGKLADSNITNAKMADNSITTTKIADANVTTSKIADANITTAKISDQAITLPKIAPNVLTAAAGKADEIVAISTTVYTNPAIQQHHPSAAKFWCKFDGSTTIPTLLGGYNVASVTRAGTAGFYNINFIVPFADVHYCVSGMSSTATTESRSFVISSQQTTFFQFGIVNYAGTVLDTYNIHVHGFGLQ